MTYMTKEGNRLKINLAVNTSNAFAPASLANFAVGFDILGLPIKGVGDKVRLNRRDDNQVIIKQISGVKGSEKLPSNTTKNVAAAVIIKLLEDYKLSCGFDIYIKKGIPLSSGMGGSAASSVAALVALNEFLSPKLSLKELAEYAIYGENVASGNYHGDNVVPALFGEFVLLKSSKPLLAITLPRPNYKLVVIHPEIEVKTKDARKLLETPFKLEKYVEQSGNLAAFISSLYTGDEILMQKCIQDVLIEPRRAKLITGFNEAKCQAFKNGAFACSISGSGPAMFAVTKDTLAATKVADAMSQTFKQIDLNSNYWISDFSASGAHLCSNDSSTDTKEI